MCNAMVSYAPAAIHFCIPKSLNTHMKQRLQWNKDGLYDDAATESAIPPDHIRRREEALAQKPSDEACSVLTPLKAKVIEPILQRSSGWIPGRNPYNCIGIKVPMF